MDIFEACRNINNHIIDKNELMARNELIKLLHYHKTENIPYTPIVNHLIRTTGLYPYIDPETSSWQDRFVYESFKVDIGDGDTKTLHREQSLLLKKLIEGRDIAVSAPTSFGKSFVIDAFISITNPTNVAIIVPTNALADETRRRLHKKFSKTYKIITTSDITLSEKNIFVFPQERASSYIKELSTLDILVIDEFYKASQEHDKERSPSLQKAIIQLGKIAKQKYFLAPNITTINENPLTRGFEVLNLDFNTVYLEKHELYKSIRNDVEKKKQTLISLLSNNEEKTLIYAGTYKNIETISGVIVENEKIKSSPILKEFSGWLAKNYSPNWNLIKLAERGFGIHNGKLHRSISQIQIKLFDLEDGLTGIVSTSSIIEGVNTSAERVILWQCKNGGKNLNDFTFRNIIGRSGRMFKHFIGHVYLLDKPPSSEETQLNIDLPDELLPDLDENEFKNDLTADQIAKIIAYKEEVAELLGVESYHSIAKENLFQSGSHKNFIKIAREISKYPNEWLGLAYLNNSDPDNWDRPLYKLLKIVSDGWETSHSNLVKFIKIISKNWSLSFPDIIRSLKANDITMDDYFALERVVSFKLSTLLNDVNIILKKVLKNGNVDISPFAFKTSHAFLPPLVYDLEEYGLPRMISRKLHDAEILDFESKDTELHDFIDLLVEIGYDRISSSISTLDRFDLFVLEHFFDGITPKEI